MTSKVSPTPNYCSKFVSDSGETVCLSYQSIKQSPILMTSRMKPV